MKALVTGGAGFIGSHLAERLVRDGYDVTVLDNLSTGRRENLSDPSVLVQADVRDRARLPEIFDRIRPEVVFHLAAQMNVRRSIADPIEDADVNILGSLNVFRSAARSGVRRVIFASSGGAVYGEQSRYPCYETDVPAPVSPYGIAKLSVEHYGRYFADRAGLEFTALRIANVYGPRQYPAGEAGVVALFLDELQKGRSPIIFGDGGQTRDFVWVGDVVEAFVLAMAGPPGIYNVGTATETSIVDLFRCLTQVVGFAPPPRHVASVGGEVRRNAVSFTRAQGLLGWTPSVSLARGLERTAARPRASA